MPAQAEVLLFAIRAAIRINEQVRRGFADIVEAKEIHLPPPDFPSTTPSSSRFSSGHAAGVRELTDIED